MRNSPRQRCIHARLCSQLFVAAAHGRPAVEANRGVHARLSGQSPMHVQGRPAVSDSSCRVIRCCTGFRSEGGGGIRRMRRRDAAASAAEWPPRHSSRSGPTATAQYSTSFAMCSAAGARRPAEEGLAERCVDGAGDGLDAPHSVHPAVCRR
jgi:hypothetical protein